MGAVINLLPDSQDVRQNRISAACEAQVPDARDQ